MLKLLKRQARYKSLFQRIKSFLLDDESKSKEIEPVQRIVRQPVTPKQEIEKFQQVQDEIGDMERIRMRKLDQKLETDTYFHETAPYEERIDSEHIMKRSYLAKREYQIEKDLFFSSHLSIDPQQKIEKPYIHNLKEFQQQTEQIIDYPDHHKQFQDGDFFKYFEKSHYDEANVKMFQIKEHLYLQQVQISTHKAEQIIQEQYKQLIYQQSIPLVQIQIIDTTFLEKQIKELKFEADIDDDNSEELVFHNSVLIKNLPEKYYDFKLDIEEQTIENLYVDLQPSSDYSKIGFIFKFEDTYTLFIKSPENTFLLENVGNSFAFKDNSVIYIERSDLGVPISIVQQQLDKSKNKVKIYDIQIGQNAHIINLDENTSLIKIVDLNNHDNQYLDLQGNIILPFQQEVKYSIDYNQDGIYYTKQTLQEKPQQLYFKSKVVFSCSGQDYIQSFCTNNKYLILLIQGQDRQYLQIKKGMVEYQFKIFEHQYYIEQENNQIKNSQYYYFSICCPYKPYQILKFNVDIQSVEILFETQYPGFQKDALTVEKLKYLDEKYIYISYLQNPNFQFIVLKLIDSNVQSLSVEDILLMKRGAAICQININQSNSEQYLNDIKDITNTLKVLSPKILLHSNGPISGLIASFEFYNNRQYVGLFCHNGVFDNKQQIVNLPISSYNYQKIPSVRNTVFSYDVNYEPRKWWPLLRSNPHNKVDLKNNQFGVNLIVEESEESLEIQRLAILEKILS
ncbi:hypothetical protein pb186bvf_016494 [Paramecium bursaria]